MILFLQHRLALIKTIKSRVSGFFYYFANIICLFVDLQLLIKLEHNTASSSGGDKK